MDEAIIKNMAGFDTETLAQNCRSVLIIGSKKFLKGTTHCLLHDGKYMDGENLSKYLAVCSSGSAYAK